jgi:Cu/Ag efflux pump CusA
MALEHGSEANQPLALAVVGGLTSSTILSLFLVPVMYLFFAKEHGSSENAVDAPDVAAHPVTK